MPEFNDIAGNTELSELNYLLQRSQGNSNTVNNTAVETLINGSHSFIIPANTLQVGDVVLVKAKGRVGRNATAPSLTIRFKNNLINLVTSVTTFQKTASIFVGFDIEIYLRIVSIGASGQYSVHMVNMQDDVTIIGTEFMGGDIIVATLSTPINTTIANTLQFSAQWSSANASYTIIFEETSYQKLKT